MIEIQCWHRESTINIYVTRYLYRCIYCLFKLYEYIYTLGIHIVDKNMSKNDNFLPRHSLSNDNIENIYAYHADEGH